MNFLGLWNRSRRECGVSGADATTIQANLSVEGQRFKDWVLTAWEDVQLMRTDWQWMRKTATFNTVAGQAGYTLAQAGATDCAEWMRESFRDYLTSVGVAGETFMTYRAYGDFRDLYEFSSMRLTQSRPMEITVKPDHTLAMWPLPNAVYTITGEYYRVPTVLSADADDPSAAGNDLPVRFHMLLVAKVMRSYAAFESAPEVESRGMMIERRKKAELENWGLIVPTMAGALA